MSTDQQRLDTATDLLRRALDGFSAFVHGRKLARKARDLLRSDIERFLNGRKDEKQHRS